MCPRAAREPALRLLALGALLWPAAGAWELTILHTNDVHSRLEQTSEDSSKCVNASRCVGGVARLFTKVQEIRRAEPHVLLLDAGDQYQGTLWFTVYKGAEVVHFMNALRYDAMVRGRLRGGAGAPAGGVPEPRENRGEGAVNGMARGGKPRTRAHSDVGRKPDSGQCARWMQTQKSLG